jgi:hypothetical protein
MFDQWLGGQSVDWVRWDGSSTIELLPDAPHRSRRAAGRPATADVLAAAASEPITPALFTQLSAIDATTLTSADDRAALAAAWDRLTNHCTARRGEAVAALAAHETPNPVLSAGEVTVSLVAEAVAVGLGEADNLVATAHALSPGSGRRALQCGPGTCLGVRPSTSPCTLCC